LVEQAGISTISLSPIPDFTRSVRAPRVVGVPFPPGLTMGPPGDAETQRAVLRGALRGLRELTEPGQVGHLSVAWPDSARKLRKVPKEPPPIATYLKRRPWLFPKMLLKMGPAKEN
jgi:hypothetical protein